MTQIAVARKSHENEIHAAYRVELKSNQNLVIWQVQSESGHTYNVSLLDGNVSGCEREDHETCPGFRYRHNCHHAAMAQQKEDERAAAALLSAKVSRRIAQIDARIAQVTEELHTCDTCWRQVKPEFTTCSVCLGY